MTGYASGQTAGLIPRAAGGSNPPPVFIRARKGTAPEKSRRFSEEAVLLLCMGWCYTISLLVAAAVVSMFVTGNLFPTIIIGGLSLITYIHAYTTIRDILDRD